MTDNLTVAYAVLGVYLLLVGGSGVLGAFMNFRNLRAGSADRTGPLTGAPGALTREHFMAGIGLGHISWFFSMAATLFSGYSVSGIVNEAYNSGWTATRWIPAGVGVYVGFTVLAPRYFALGKQRGYMTISELIFDRYLPPSGGKVWVAHALRLLSFAFLQLPIFTYLITQFRSVGVEVSTFTQDGIPALTAVCVAGAMVLVCDWLGGMRAVAYSDVLQGVVLFIGSAIFLIIQRTELGGLPKAWEYWSNPANLAQPRVANMQLLPSQVQVVNYFDFVAKTTVAATMFPHLCQRLFCSRTANVMRRGLSATTFMFFLVQLSSMITGWVAISALVGKIRPKASAFASTLLEVADGGPGQSFLAALLLASAVCAMMSTADSALLAFSTMWVRDVFKPYLWRSSSDAVQLVFGKFMATIALAVGVLLSMMVIQTGKPDLSGLFSLQNVTPIHVAPAVWLGLHWRGLRGEAVLAGMVAGGAVTIGLVFSDKNVRLAAGDDMLANGLSSSWVGLCVNAFVTITLGLTMQHGPKLTALLRRTCCGKAGPVGEGTGLRESHPRWLDIGPVHDRLASWWLWSIFFLTLLFSVPFCFTGTDKHLTPNAWVGSLSAWAFTSLLISGIMSLVASLAYLKLWQDYKPLLYPAMPMVGGEQADEGRRASETSDGSAAGDKEVLVQLAAAADEKCG